MTTAIAPETPADATHEVGPATSPVPAATQTPVLSIIALVSSISAIAFGLVFPLSIVAIVLGIYGLKREPQARTMAIWSIVLGSVPFAIGVVVATLGIAFFVPLGLFAAFGGF